MTTYATRALTTMTSMPRLVIVTAPAVHVRADGAVLLDDKTADGLRQYAGCFPGETVLLARRLGTPPESAPGVAYHSPDSLGLSVATGDPSPPVLADLDADIALIPLLDAFAPLTGVARHTVVIAEHSGASRLEMARALGGSRLDLARQRLGFTRWERRMRRVAEAADGVQCNGAVAWTTYGANHRHALGFYDHRLRAEDISAAADARHQVTPRVPGQALRLGFTGRLIAIKGPGLALDLVVELHRRGVDAELIVLGDGPMRDELAGRALPGVDLRGIVPFRPDWVRQVSQEVDVMVLPYVQSDPAGSYAESIGLGAPVLGFSNAAWSRMLAETGAGWAVPVADVRALADVAERLSADPAQVRRASQAGLDYLRGRDVDAEFRRRSDHLVALLD